MTLRKLIPADVTISVHLFDEDVSPRDSYSVPGITDPNSNETKRFVAAVEEMIEKHGLWGWCRVEVQARFDRLIDVAHLGGCSYASEEEFRHPSGYFPQLVDEAIEDLQRQLTELNALLSELPIPEALR